MFNPALHCQYCYDFLNRVFDHKTSDCRRSRSSHSSNLAIHTSLLAFHHPFGQPPATTTNITDEPLTAHVDATNTNAEVPNATAPATVNHPATEAHVSATPIATTSGATTETAVSPELFLSVEVLPNKSAPSIDVSSDDFVDAGEEYSMSFITPRSLIANRAQLTSRRKTMSGTGTTPITSKG